MPLRTDMPTRADARPDSGDERHATVYDAERGSWQPQATGTREVTAAEADRRASEAAAARD